MVWGFCVYFVYMIPLETDVNIVSKNDVSMCNISMERKICRLHGGMKTTILHNLINHNTNLNDPWLRSLDHNSFQTCWNSQKVKLLTTIYVIYQLISEYNY